MFRRISGLLGNTWVSIKWMCSGRMSTRRRLGLQKTRNKKCEAFTPCFAVCTSRWMFSLDWWMFDCRVINIFPGLITSLREKAISSAAWYLYLQDGAFLQHSVCLRDESLICQIFASKRRIQLHSQQKTGGLNMCKKHQLNIWKYVWASSPECLFSLHQHHSLEEKRLSESQLKNPPAPSLWRSFYLFTPDRRKHIHHRKLISQWKVHVISEWLVLYLCL